MDFHTISIVCSSGGNILMTTTMTDNSGSVDNNLKNGTFVNQDLFN